MSKNTKVEITTHNIDRNEELSICMIDSFPEDEFTILSSKTDLDFVSGCSIDVVFKVIKDNSANYYSVVTDTIVLKYSLTLDEMIGDIDE